jgi:LysR family transcriptional regulator, carnitine catabolism transcriptional activator
MLAVATGSPSIPHQIPLSLSLRQMQVFLRVAELLSFSEAGRALHVSQPALTRNIQQTEEIIGARLFDRSTRKVELTPVGTQLLPIARRVLYEFETACSEMAHFIDALKGNVNVAAMPSVAAALLPQAITKFRHRYPNVDFRITELRSPKIPEAVADGACDFGVTVQASNNSRVAYRPLLDDDIYLVCRADAPIAARKSVPWTVFKDLPFIAMVSGCSIRAIAENVFRKLELDIKPHYECQHLSTAFGLIEAGLGISAVSSLMILHQVKYGNLVALPLIQPSASRPVGIITRVGRSMSPAAQQFVKTLLTEAPRLIRTASSQAEIRHRVLFEPRTPQVTKATNIDK